MHTVVQDITIKVYDIVFVFIIPRGALGAMTENGFVEIFYTNSEKYLGCTNDWWA